MFTPFDAVEVDAPSTGTGQKSMFGNNDKMKGRLLKFRKDAK